MHRLWCAQQLDDSGVCEIVALSLQCDYGRNSAIWYLEWLVTKHREFDEWHERLQASVNEE